MQLSISGADATLVANRIAEAALLEKSSIRSPRSGSHQLNLSLSRDLPLDVAYDVAVVLPEGKRDLGSLVHDVGAAGTNWGFRIPLGQTSSVNSGDFLRFTFTPNLHAAARLAGIEQIAGEPFEVELIVPEDPESALIGASRVLTDPG